MSDLSGGMERCWGERTTSTPIREGTEYPITC
jgi:hypothetical protein